MMKSRIPASLRPIAGALAIGCLLASAAPVFPQTSTWIGGASGDTLDWNNSLNWTPNTIPNSTSAQANFPTGASNITPAISGTAISVGSIVFGAGSPAYTVTVADSVSSGGSLDIYGAGISNSYSGQTFTFQNSYGYDSTITFHNSSSAGNASFQVVASGTLNFNDSSSASQAYIVVNNGALNFNTNSTAGSANITNVTNNIASIAAGVTSFSGSSTAGSSTIANTGASYVEGASSVVATGYGSDDQETNRSTGSDIYPGHTYFMETSSAGNALISNLNGGYTSFLGNSTAGNAIITNSAGGDTYFFASASAGSANITINSGSFVFFTQASTATNATTITINAGGFLDISTLTNGGISIGQVSGAGNIYLGATI